MTLDSTTYIANNGPAERRNVRELEFNMAQLGPGANLGLAYPSSPQAD